MPKPSFFQLSLYLVVSFFGLDASNKTDKEVIKKEHYKYDPFGNLVIDASMPMPDDSPPILLDSKKYYPTCTTNVYFTFTFKISPTINKLETVCDQGITICYEGQLVGDHLRTEYLLENVKTKDAEQWTKACIAANKNKTTDGIRALNVAVKTVQGLTSESIQSEDEKLKETNGFGNYSNKWHFFVIGSTFIEQQYYFIVPEDGILILHIGERKSLEISITNSAGNPISMVKFTHDTKTFGVIESLKISTILHMDRANGHMMRDYRGLWMFYLDFKSDYRTWQAISTVHPIVEKKKQPCPLSLEIRGNRMRPCRSYFEDIAIFDEVNAPVNISYTTMVGTVKTQNTIDGNYFTRDPIKNGRKKTMQITKGEHEVSLHLNPEQTVADQTSDATGSGNAGGADVKLSGYVNWQRTNFESNLKQDLTMKSGVDKNTKTMFSDITRSQSMMQSFKKSEGIAEEMSSTDFLQTMNAFTTWEAVDVTVQVSPKTKLYIRQLMFDCDGNLIKMPFVYYSDGKSKINMNDKNIGPKRSKRNIGWSNLTLGEAAVGLIKNEMGF